MRDAVVRDRRLKRMQFLESSVKSTSAPQTRVPRKREEGLFIWGRSAHARLGTNGDAKCGIFCVNSSVG